MTSSTITWPAMVKYAGESELTYIRNQLDWECDADLDVFDCDEGDLLIDSKGQVFALSNRNADSIVATPDDQTLSCAEVAELIRNHFSSVGECCISKFRPGSIEECLRILGQASES